MSYSWKKWLSTLWEIKSGQLKKETVRMLNYKKDPNNNKLKEHISKQQLHLALKLYFLFLNSFLNSLRSTAAVK